MGSTKEEQGIVDRFLTSKYDELVNIIVSKYDPDRGRQPPKYNHVFRRTSMSGRELAHEAMFEVAQTVNIVELMRIPEGDRDRYLFGCVLRAARFEFISLCLRERNRLDLESGAVLQRSLGPSDPHSGQGGFKAVEFEDALSAVPADQRAVLRNLDEHSMRDLHRRMAGSISHTTFNSRVKSKLGLALETLFPE